MLRRAGWLGVAFVALAGGAHAADAPPLAVSADATVADAVRVVVTVENSSGEPVSTVAPEVR